MNQKLKIKKAMMLQFSEDLLEKERSHSKMKKKNHKKFMKNLILRRVKMLIMEANQKEENLRNLKSPQK